MADQARTRRLLNGLPPGLTIAAYWSNNHEPDTTILLRQLHVAGYPLLLPQLTRSRSEPSWTWWDGQDLQRSPVGLASPVGPTVDPSVLERVDLMIMPGLAATPQGDRLGRGGGWYDRCLASLASKPQRWLLLNHDEVLDVLPTDPWDQGVDAIITDQAWINVNRVGQAA